MTRLEKRQKWIMWAGFAGLLALFFGLTALCFARGFDGMEPPWLFNTGADLLGVAVSAVLYYSCITDLGSGEESAGHFAALIAMNAFTLFNDAVGWLLEGNSALRELYIGSTICFYLDGVIIVYLLLRYLRSALSIPPQMALWARRLSIWLLVPAVAAILANLFTPLYFQIDAESVYRRMPYYPFTMTYFCISFVISVVLVLASDNSPHKRRIMLTFMAMPVVNIASTGRIYGVSTQYVTTLLSIILIYGAVYSDRGRQIAISAAELELGAKIQTAAMNKDFPEDPRYSIAASMEPAKEVGGDFYDFFPVDDDRLALVMADVSGKGVPAALFMMNAKAQIKGAMQKGLSPAETLYEVNAQLCVNNTGHMFMTAWIGIVELSTGKLAYADAGHEELLLRQNGAWRFVPKTSGVALAVWEPKDLAQLEDPYQFTDTELYLRPGDMLIQYTDGVTEATNDKGDMFGTARLLSAVRATSSNEPQTVLERVQGEISAFAHETPQFDDVTLLCMELK